MLPLSLKSSFSLLLGAALLLQWGCSSYATFDKERTFKPNEVKEVLSLSDVSSCKYIKNIEFHSKESTRSNAVQALQDKVGKMGGNRIRITWEDQNPTGNYSLGSHAYYCP